MLSSLTLRTVCEYENMCLVEFCLLIWWSPSECIAKRAYVMSSQALEKSGNMLVLEYFNINTCTWCSHNMLLYWCYYSLHSCDVNMKVYIQAAVPLTAEHIAMLQTHENPVCAVCSLYIGCSAKPNHLPLFLLHIESSWRTTWTAAYTGTVVLAFICSAMYMIFFINLVVFQGECAGMLSALRVAHLSSRSRSWNRKRCKPSIYEQKREQGQTGIELGYMRQTVIGHI
jgi:hypothetical protein